MNNALIRAVSVSRQFDDGHALIRVLKSVDLTVMPGEVIAIIGQSGSGKSTLLQLLGGLESPDAGEIYWGEHHVAAQSERMRCALRNKHLGFVYQSHHLLPEFTALENVAMPLLIAKKSGSHARVRATDLLSQVGLLDRVTHKIGELSGGERQRVAFARALAMNPPCLLADEPTGNLDVENSEHVFEMMLALQKAHQTTVVMVTHDAQLASRADRVFRLVSGVLLAQRK